MRRPLKNPSLKLSADSLRLVNLAQAMARASSRLEERAWERSLDLLLQKLLKHNHQDTVNAALDHLFHSDLPAYEALMDTVEAVSSAVALEHDGQHYDALLIAAPVLAWTRYAIPAAPLPSEVLNILAAHLHGHLLADETRLAIAPMLYAIDQLPPTHADTLALTQRMAQAALAGKPVAPMVNPPQTAPFLADTRYLLAVVVAASGAPLFRWQAMPSPANVSVLQDEALLHWRQQVSPTIERLLPGCGFELLLPEAYYIACREADQQIRPVTIRAAVNYLAHVLAAEPSSVTAIVGGFAEDSMNGRVDEYRISFSIKEQAEVIYGIVWPLYGQEDANEEMPASDPDSQPMEQKTPLQQIMGLLHDCGITDVKVHRELFQVEYCEDCGAPLYCDREAELVHAETPEDATPGSNQLH